jgi:menaquinone-dependent protoporphyrinogen oxidase
MHVLVVYGSRLGATRGIAERIGAQLREDRLDVVVQPASEAIVFTDADAFVIGSGVYAGHWVREAADYVRRNRAILVRRPVWLFSSGPVGDLATRHEPVEPKDVGALRAMVNPREHRVFAGALDRSTLDGSTLGRAERLVARTMIPEGDYRDWAAIDAWTAGIAREIARVPARRSFGSAGPPGGSRPQPASATSDRLPTR